MSNLTTSASGATHGLHSSNVQHPVATKKKTVPFPDAHGGGEQPEVFEVQRRYDVVGPISRGTYGYVARAIDEQLAAEQELLSDEERNTNAAPGTVAIKKVRGLFGLGIQRLWVSAVRELTMLRFFDHPNVIRAKHIMIPLGDHYNLSPQSIQVRKQQFDEVYIVMDYMDYTLRGLMNSSEAYAAPNPLAGQPGYEPRFHRDEGRWEKLHGLSASKRAFLLFQILHGVNHLHQSGIMHRDLKPDNILVDWQWCAKLCDFGQSRGIHVDPTTPTAVNETTFGQVTQWYCSPEFLNFNPSTLAGQPAEQQRVDPATFHAIDVWSVGCIAAEMIVGKPLFDSAGGGGASQLDTIMNVLGRPNEKDSEALKQCNSGIATVLTQSRVDCTENRLDAVLRAGVLGRPEELLHEEGEREAPDENEIALIAAMLQYDPARRITIAEALASPLFTNYLDYTPVAPPPRSFPSLGDASAMDEQEARRRIWDLFLETDENVRELIHLFEFGPGSPRVCMPKPQSQSSIA